MKKFVLTLLILTIAALASPPLPALALPTLEAQRLGDGLAVEWTGCECAEATLTIYLENWPVLVTCVPGGEGSYAVPEQYTRTPGRYAAQIRCQEGCVRAEAGRIGPSEPQATEAPTQTPVVVSTPTPTQAATQSPTEAPTPVTTPDPTPVATPVATPDPTPVATPVATPDPTPAATPVATPDPTEVPTPRPTEAQQGTTLSSLADEVVRQVNAERAKRGLNALSTDPELERAAAVRAQELLENFSHTRPDGSSWSSVSSAARGENIAMGHDSADRVMAAWMSSDGHRANILRESFSTIGVCALEADGILYWVQLFGG